MLVLATLALGLLAFDLIGYSVHWLMHRRWSGSLYRAHQAHHRLYTPKHPTSPAYHHPGKDSTAIRFTILVVAAIVAAFLLLPLKIALILGAEWGSFGIATNIIHDATHLHHSWLDSFGWFRRLRTLHFMHHANQKKNYGIILFWSDRVLGSYLIKVH
jgi:sterol desaturase/sphingolipid hydroxylase (fatty acid hydroxylase superfamily)